MHSTEIKCDLDKVYKCDALSYPTILRWIFRFKSGRDSIEDDSRSCRPLLAIGKNDVVTVKQCISEDVRHTVDDIANITGSN